MKVLGLAAQKGGAGKTTVAVHIAVMAEQDGWSVVLVDADPQRSAARWWHRREAETPTMVEAAPDDIQDVKRDAEADGVDLLIIDTAPAHGSHVAAVARAADFLAIPTRPGALDLDAIGPTVEVATATNARAGIVLNACPPGRGAGEASLTREAREALADAPIPTAPASITQRAALSHALIDGRAVSEFEPAGKASRELRNLWAWIQEQMGNE